MKNIYHIFAHPDIEKSRANKEILKAFIGKDNIKSCLLYESYPDWKIDINKEKENLLKADIIVVQTPFYWYSTPGLFKEWQDKVLEYGFAYGEGGDKLKGKKLQIVLSTFGPAEAYQKGGYNNFTIEELLRPIEQTANLCQLEYLKPLVIYGITHKSEEEITAFKDFVSSEISKLSS